MSIKFLFVFALFVVAALSAPLVEREHKVEAIGDITDTKVEKTENGINVKGMMFFYYFMLKYMYNLFVRFTQ